MISQCLQSLNPIKSQEKLRHHMISSPLKRQLMKQYASGEEKGKPSSQRVRFTPLKWKILMVQILNEMTKKPERNTLFGNALRKCVEGLDLQCFKEAILQMQADKFSFKPLLKTVRLSKDNKSLSLRDHLFPKPRHSQSPVSVLKQSEPNSNFLRKNNPMNYSFQRILLDEISSRRHPFYKIMKEMTSILENIYRDMIQLQLKSKKIMEIEQLIALLNKDFAFIVHFLSASAKPIFDSLSHDSSQWNEKRKVRFISDFLRNSDRILLTFKKIIKYFLKFSPQMKDFQTKSPDLADISHFPLQQDLKIEGCYVYTTNQLVQFSQLTKGQQYLGRLASIRTSICKDIDEYYENTEKKQLSLEVGSDAQLEILKFVLSKVKVFGAEILASLKLLQVIYGEAEMSFHFGGASYIHTQLTIAFQAIQNGL